MSFLWFKKKTRTRTRGEFRYGSCQMSGSSDGSPPASPASPGTSVYPDKQRAYTTIPLQRFLSFSPIPNARDIILNHVRVSYETKNVGDHELHNLQGYCGHDERCMRYPISQSIAKTWRRKKRKGHETGFFYYLYIPPSSFKRIS